MNVLTKYRLAIAIAVAERGFEEIFSGSCKNNNPGDMKDETGNIHHYEFSVDGWYALSKEIELIYDGKSKYYNLNMTIADMAVKYTGNDNPSSWAATVCGILGVTPLTKLSDILF